MQVMKTINAADAGIIQGIQPINFDLTRELYEIVASRVFEKLNIEPYDISNAVFMCRGANQVFWLENRPFQNMVIQLICIGDVQVTDERCEEIRIGIAGNEPAEASLVPGVIAVVDDEQNNYLAIVYDNALVMLDRLTMRSPGISSKQARGRLTVTSCSEAAAEHKDSQ